MIHELNLHPGPYRYISNGKKDIEMRLNEEKRRLIKVGDYIRFTNVETGETVMCLVLSLTPYKDFKELYEAYPKTRLGYESWQKASYKDMAQYYSDEKIDKYGALAIEIKLIEE